MVLRDLNLRVPRGAVYGLLGRNGAGKTTALRLLLGILAPDSGTLTIDGQTVARGTARLRQRIGYVSQEQHFYPWMRVRRLGRFVGGFYPTWDRVLFRELLDQLAIDPRQRAGELSGGTRMKLAMALALAHRPRVLVLDEPTAGVDPVTRREILDLLRRLVDQEQRTVLFSTHHVEEVEELSDHVGILREGNLFWQGPLADFAAHVRRVAGELPPDARPLHVADDHTVAWADPTVWRAHPAGESVSLETAFVAITRDHS